MKKFISMLLIATLSLSVAACTSDKEPIQSEDTVQSEEVQTEEVEEVEEEQEEEQDVVEGNYVDGVYTVEGDTSSDWQDIVTVTVEGGVITDVVWDAVNEAGESKLEQSKAGNYNMNTELAWHEQAELMGAELIATQDPAAIGVNADGKTDTVTSVSITVEGFVALATEACNQATAGADVADAAVEGDLKDGVYTAEGDTSSDWQDIVTVTVEGGVITDVVWDAVNEAGESKLEQSKAGNYNMNTELAWHEQAELMGAELIATQDPAAIGVNADGKTDTVASVSITVEGFVTLATEAVNQAK